MTDNLKRFLEAVSANAEMMKKLDKASKEDIISLAAELGIELTDADFVQRNELSEDELDTVVGGSGGCGCAAAGGGGGKDIDDGKTFGCACVGYGQGGDGSATDLHCICICGGVGEDRNVKSALW